MATLFDQAKAVYTYESFLEHLEQLLAENKTTGDDQSEKYLHFAKLNLQRMHRWNKTFTVGESLKAKVMQVQPQTWWVITEGWCGDSAQNLPIIAQVAAVSQGKIDLKIVLRDENPEIINDNLTNGGKSIPVLVAMNSAEEKLFRWGPRPAPAQDLLLAWKASETPMSFEDFEKQLHTWYTQDKGMTTQKELEDLL
jgi:hypothetical protein